MIDESGGLFPVVEVITHVFDHTSTYISIGSPTPSISGITHFKSNAFASTILNIFCTFIDAEVEQNMREACIARANRFAYHNSSAFPGECPRNPTCFVISSCSSLGNVANWSNFVPIKNGIAVWKLWLARQNRGNKNEDMHLIETSRLSIPFLHWIQRWLAW